MQRKLKCRGGLLALTVAWALSSTAYAQQCQNKDGVWVHEDDGIRHVLYGTDGLNMFSEVNLEEWRGDRLAWRAKGTVTCSNGVSVCYLLLPNNSGLSGNDATTSIIIEQIDEHNDGLGEWVVLAAMNSALWYSGGAKVEWFDGFRPEPEDERVTAPNVYRLEKCRKLNGGAGPIEATRSISGTLYGTPELCTAYRREGSLIPDDLPDGRFNDGYWWLDDNSLVGWELECRVTDRTKFKLTLACAGEALEWEESKYIRSGDGWVEIDGTRLERCARR